MRAWIVLPLLAATFAAVVLSPADARNAGGARHGMAASRHFGIATPHRVFIVPSRSGNRVVVVSRPFGRFGAFDGFRRVTPFGFPFPFFDGLGGFDGFAGFDGFDAFTGFGAPTALDAAPPSIVLSTPQPPPPVPVKMAGDLPPCRETTPVGVVIWRLTGCSREAH